MDAVYRAVLLVALSGVAAHAQSPTSGGVNYLQDDALNQYIGTATLGGVDIASHVATIDQPSTVRMYDNSAGLRRSLLEPNYWCTAPAGSATFRSVTPFRYTAAKDSSDYFPVKLGPLRYTFWSGNPQSQRPAGGRLQSLVDSVLRHYTSDPVVPVNKRCIRMLSCNSLYEQALRRRSADR